MTPPLYIAFEGAEGCGKSTQARLFADYIGATLTRETGGTAIGQRVRTILHDTSVTNLDDRAEALLIAADRAQHVAEVVAPALQHGHVVSDRSVYSSLAYQGYGRGIDLDDLGRINDWALHGRWPDVVVWLRVDAAVAAQRIGDRELDRFEQAGDDFHQRVSDGFARMAANDPDRWVIVDANGSIDSVHVDVCAALDRCVAHR